MEFDQVMQRRRSVRGFQAKPIEQEKLKTILEAARQAPSAGNLQAYQIAVIQDKVLQNQLAQAALGQNFIIQAPVVLVFLADPEQSASRYGQRGLELYSIQDATIAASLAWLKAVDQGLAACWVGAFNPHQVNQVLEAPNTLKAVVILPIGYSAEDAQATSRKSLDELIIFSKLT